MAEGQASARPARLRALSEQGLEQVARWEEASSSLSDALAALRADMAGADLPDHLRVPIPLSDFAFSSLVGDQSHLDAWVGEVADDFMAADSPWLPSLLAYVGDGVVTVPAARIEVGFAGRRREELRQEGIREAAELEALLADAGIDADDFDPGMLADLDPESESYADLIEAIARIDDRLAFDDAYATGVFVGLGPGGIRASLAVVESYAAHRYAAPLGGTGYPAVPDLGDPVEMLDNYVAGFGHASHHLDADTAAGLLEESDDAWRSHQLGLLISGDSAAVDPEFLAGAAGVILVGGRNHVSLGENAIPPDRAYEQEYPPMWMAPEDLWGRPRLGAPQLVALEALAGNVEASWHFATRGQDHVAALLRPLEVDGMGSVVHGGSNLDRPGALTERDLRTAVEAAAEQATTNALVDAVEARPERLADVVVDQGHASVPPAGRLFLDVMSVTAEGGVSEPMRTLLAGTLDAHDYRYLDVLSVEIDSYTTTDTDGIALPTAERFLRELTVIDDVREEVDGRIATWQQREVDSYVMSSTDGDALRRAGAVGMLDATAEVNAILDAEQAQIAGEQRWAARIDSAVGAIPIGGNAMAALNAINGITGAEAQVSIGNSLVDFVVSDDGNLDEARHRALRVLAQQEVAHLDILTRSLYEGGRLGTPDEIRNSETADGARFIDADGEIMPIDIEADGGMSGPTLESYMRWLQSDEVLAVAGGDERQRLVDINHQRRFLAPFALGDSFSLVVGE